MKTLNIPTNPAEKLDVLKRTRELFTDPDKYAAGEWAELINGVEAYCLYGGIEHMMGVDFEELVHEEGAYDQHVDQCSLTSQMFAAALAIDAIDKDTLSYMNVDACINWDEDAPERKRDLTDPSYSIEAVLEGRRHSAWSYAKIKAKQNLLDEAIMENKRHCLQAINDNKGRLAVLDVLDRAIADLQVEVDAS